MAKIIDYCWLQGHTPDKWGSWLPWKYTRLKSATKSELSRWNNGTNWNLDLFAYSGRVSSAKTITDQSIKYYYDYWLKIDLELDNPNEYRRIENLKLVYNGSASNVSNWTALVYKTQTDAICAPINYPAEWSAAQSFNWTCAPGAYNTPQNYSTLIADNKMLCAAERHADEPTSFYLSFDLNNSNGNIYYINIKQLADNARPIDTGAASNLWELKTDYNVIPKNYTITYKSVANGPQLDEKTGIKEPGKGYTLSDPASLWGEACYGYTFIGWIDENGKQYKEKETYTTDADLTLTAHWEAHKYNLIVTQAQMDWNNKNTIPEREGKLPSLLNTKISMNQKLEIDVQISNNNHLSLNSNIVPYISNDYLSINVKKQNDKTLKMEVTCIKGYADDNKDIELKLKVFPDRYAVIYPDGTKPVIYYYNLPTKFKYYAHILSDDKITINEDRYIESAKGIAENLYLYDINSDMNKWEYKNLIPFDSIDFNLERVLKQQIDAWKIDDLNDYQIYAPETAAPLKPEGLTPYPKYYVWLSENGVYLDGILQKSDNPNWFQIPETAESEYWSLTVNGGTPHYRKGDYVGTHTITKLWSTTENGSDYILHPLGKKEGK